MSDHELTACVMIPHLVPVDAESGLSDLDEGYDALKHEQGYHKKIDHVECTCGERFPGDERDGRNALVEARQHVREARGE